MLLLISCGLLGGRGCDVGLDRVVLLVVVWCMVELSLSLLYYYDIACEQQLVQRDHLGRIMLFYASSALYRRAPCCYSGLQPEQEYGSLRGFACLSPREPPSCEGRC